MMPDPALVAGWLGIILAAGTLTRGLFLMVRAIVRLVDSTEHNTTALEGVTDTLKSLSRRVDVIEQQQQRQDGAP